MPTSNPYPGRAIASFLLVGAAGVAIFFTGTPTPSEGSARPIVAEDEPPPKSSSPTTPAPSHPVTRAPTATAKSSAPSTRVPSYGRHDTVFSYPVTPPRAETPAVPTSAAPAPTQGVPAPTPEAPDPAPLGSIICTIVGSALNGLICSD